MIRYTVTSYRGDVGSNPTQYLITSGRKFPGRPTPKPPRSPYRLERCQRGDGRSGYHTRLVTGGTWVQIRRIESFLVSRSATEDVSYARSKPNIDDMSA